MFYWDSFFNFNCKLVWLDEEIEVSRVFFRIFIKVVSVGF